MIAALFVWAAAAYAIYGLLAYNEAFRGKPWYVVACLACALAANLGYIYVTKRLGDSNKIFLAGLGWDLMLVCVQATVPICLGAIPFRPGVVAGVLLVAAGITVVNYSLHG